MEFPTETAPEGFIHAWRSVKHDRLYGYGVYKRPDGSSINVSCVSEAPDSGMKWGDLQYLGLVIHYLSGGCIGSYHT